MTAFDPLRSFRGYGIGPLMLVEIYHDGKLIGRSNLDAADPPMGVATGPFEPCPDYVRNVHAGEIEGTHNPSGANQPYIVKSAEHGSIECQAVFIQDYAEGLDERLVSLLGVTHPSYEALFGEYPSYKAYFRKP